ncbi:MAG: hypothetical protein ABWW66_01445 [Archaeoglobaceae archaeon]
MVTYKDLLEELKKEVGPIAKIFLDRAMEVLGIEEINDQNYKDVLSVLKANRELREFVENIERRLG